MGRLDFLTDDQREAVYNRGGALLVAAAAGSGKTRVLVERLLERVCDPNEGCDIDDFLIITYTNAAAAELRGKIMAGINERLADDPSNRRLRRQQMLCHRAHIGTIHSFCSSVLKENAQLAGLAPDFRVADESESALLRRQAVEELLDSCYENMRPEFGRLLDNVSSGQDDSKLADIILEAYSTLQSHPYPQKWCDEQAELLGLDGVEDLSQTKWGEELMSYAKTKARFLQQQLREAHDDYAFDEKYTLAYGPSVEATLAALDAFCAALEGSWDGAFLCCDIPFPKAKALKGDQYEDIKALRTRVKKACEEFPKIFSGPSAQYLIDMLVSADVTRELLRLVGEFTAVYTQLKRSRGVIDFNDQEHLALSVLVDGETQLPTALAREISARFVEIMVDEYQDVNRVQELLIKAVSREESNLFMVGDVKQSIYRFRLADPSIFLEKYNAYPLACDAKPGQPRKVLLSRNFRSRKGVLDAVNCLFSDIMSTQLGEMEYTPAEYLYYGANYSPDKEPCVELWLCDAAGDGDGDEEENVNKTALEADWVARRILELKSTMRVADKDGDRPARWSDFAILMRTLSSRGSVYARVFALHSIPLSYGTGGSLFQTPEISFMLSLLSVIDNPRQDIPLISVLRSPVYGFTPDELADVRLAGGKDFYEALCARAEGDGKCRSFLKDLNALRLIAPELSTDRLIWHIYNVTDALGIYGAMPGGEERRSNLMLLFDHARRFENNGFKGLFQFITNLRELMERGEKLGQTEETVSADCVAMMTVHKSKGLEFPVVFMPDLTHRFNMRDTQKEVLMHRVVGPGLKMIDPVRRIRHDTVAHKAVARRIRTESLSEEMRVLYVGMTRAKEKLVMTAVCKDLVNTAEKLRSRVQRLPADPGLLITAASFADWVAPVVLNYGGANDPHLRGAEGEDSRAWSVRYEFGRSAAAVSADEDVAFDEPSAEEQPLEAEPVEELSVQADPQLRAEISRRLAFRYPYSAMSDLPSKLAPTELKGRLADEESALEAGEAPKLAGARRRSGGEIRRPDFAGAAPMTAAQEGTALHAFMEHSDWQRCAHIDSAKAELERIVAQGRLTKEEGDSVDLDSVVRFFTSPEGRLVLSAPKVYKEFKFSVLLPAADFFPGAGDDRVLLQGVVDCCAERDGRLTIIDFKTDRVDEDTVLERAEGYRGQLDAYAAAMESITGKPVVSEILYFTRKGIAVYLK